jgi:hypothetical protein
LQATRVAVPKIEGLRAFGPERVTASVEGSR